MHSAGWAEAGPVQRARGGRGWTQREVRAQGGQRRSGPEGGLGSRRGGGGAASEPLRETGGGGENGRKVEKEERKKASRFGATGRARWHAPEASLSLQLFCGGPVCAGV